MEEQEKALIENIKEFYYNGIEAEKKLQYNTAITLFFKALAVLSDLYIFRKERKIPSSHTERFRILEERYSDIYKLLDKDFLFYQNSYRIKLNKESCEVLKKDVEQLLKILNL